VTAKAKEQVLKALGEAATKMRQKLGESLASVEKYDAPPEDVTTPSLEALQAYSLGYRAQIVKGDWAAAVPSFQRAINLDPNFAMAYVALAASYANLNEIARAADDTRKAYELRERVSEREKFRIDSQYEYSVTGDLEATRKIYELWSQTYPRDFTPLGSLSAIYVNLGEYEQALAAAQHSLKLGPASGRTYWNLVNTYLALNRLNEATAEAEEALVHNLDPPFNHWLLYMVNFLQHDKAGMEREAAQLMDKPGYEDEMFFAESDTAAYAGQFVKARELTRRAADSARRADEEEMAASYKAEAALREALIGNNSLARRQAQDALALSNARDLEAWSAIALGLAGDSAQAMRLGNDLDKRFQKDTMVQTQFLPMIRAAIILADGMPAPGNASKNADKAVQALTTAVPYELGSRSGLYPAYLRGEAYLAAQQGAAAAAEFQKILDHPGVVVNSPTGALAHLGLGRAYALQAGVDVAAVSPPPHVNRKSPEQLAGDTPALQKARAAYQDFLALRKDADPDIPILKQAKAEYAALQ
jgi:tetratricopeptide (TPR) repeat protein